MPSKNDQERAMTSPREVAEMVTEAKVRIRRSIKAYHNADENWGSEDVNEYLEGKTNKPFKSFLDWIDEGIDALAASITPPKGCVRDSDGVDRKVLGTLPVTADGCVVGDGAEVWGSYWGGTPAKLRIKGPHVASNPWDGELEAVRCYSTRAAAESAKGAANG